MKHLFQHLQEKLVVNKNTKIVKDDEEVDLGLPSGLLWCKHNVGAEKETDRGLYFSWANIEDHEYKSGYYFNRNEYEETKGNELKSSFKPGDKEYDAATANMGPEWRMPTKDEFKELIDNTERKWTTINGQEGMKFISKKDPEKYVFFPGVGFYSWDMLDFDDEQCFYWSADIFSSDISEAYYMTLKSPKVYVLAPNFRYYGMSIRAVKN